MNAPQQIPFDPAAHWPAPDMTLLKPNRPPAPKLSSEAMGHIFGGWAPWLSAAADVKSAHVDYVSLALLTTASAIIGNSRWALPRDGWKEPPILWGMLIGEPSAGKSPALDAVLDPVREIDAELGREYCNQREDWQNKDEVARLVLAQWKSDAKSAIQNGETPPDKPKDADAGRAPIRKRIRITDATTEKVADLLATTWRGLLLSRDELSGWLGSMDRYNGGGDRPFWIEAFGGRSYTVDRKSSPEPVVVEHMSVAVLGGTQPDKLDSLLVKSDDDGLLSRFLTVFPEAGELRWPTECLDTAKPVAAFKRLRELQPAIDEHGAQRPFFVHLDDGAQAALHQFRIQCREWEGETSGLLKSHIGKMPGLVVRVALVLACLDWAGDSSLAPVSGINAGHIERAVAYVGGHLRGHAYRAYGAASVPNETRNARKLAALIWAEKPQRINAREIQRRELAGLLRAPVIKAAIAELVGADWLASVETETGGRRRTDYAVNPRLRADA